MFLNPSPKGRHRTQLPGGRALEGKAFPAPKPAKLVKTCAEFLKSGQ